MAQLKSTVVAGDLSVTGFLSTDTAKFRILQAPDASNSTTYDAGTNGQVLKSNGTSVYWASLAKGDVGLGNVENTALSTWAGTNKITTVGTISSGTWNGDTIAITKGGTGAVSASGARTNLNAATGNGRIFYGTCGTAAATATKTVTCKEYDQLVVGDVMIVTFSQTNTTNTALKMSINNTKGLTTTAKDIKCQIVTSISNIPAVGYLVAHRPYMFVYDGTYWVMMNVNRDNNSNTLLRTYSSATDIDVPLIGSNFAGSTSATWATYTDTYKDQYGAIPNDDSKRAKINLSTGLVQIPGGITSTGLITATKFKQTGTSAWSFQLDGTGWTQQTNAITTSGIAAGDYTCNKSDNTNTILASTDADLIMGLALNNTAEARVEAGTINLRLYEVTSGGVCKFTATAVPTNTINVVIKALV